jgi:capsule biosynthesis phosphatase
LLVGPRARPGRNNGTPKSSTNNTDRWRKILRIHFLSLGPPRARRSQQQQQEEERIINTQQRENIMSSSSGTTKPANRAKCIVLIPLGGLGSRFTEVGHTVPKPLIPALGDPILYWLLNALRENVELHQEVAMILIPYHPDLQKHRLEDRLVKDFPKFPFCFVKLSSNTLGAADTARIALESAMLQNNNGNSNDMTDDMPIISLDGDNFYTLDILALWDRSNRLSVFEDNGNQPIYSYVKVIGDEIVQIKEKEKIGSLACTGAYGFASWRHLLTACQATVSDPANLQKNEYYISSVIAYMMKQMQPNEIFRPLIIPRESYVCLGTPLQLRAFCNDVPRIDAISGATRIRPRRYCFDLDNTLVTFPKITGDYSSVEPISYMIDFVKYLKKFNHTIIIYTARRMATHKGNTAAALADIGPVTFATLEKFGIPFDEIVFGKPVADYYIDDLAVSPYLDVEKSLGFYPTDVKPRAFNAVTTPSPMAIIRKASIDTAALAGEIYFYNHIPLSIKDCFPIMVAYDGTDQSWYEVELINGTTASHLFLSEELTPHSFRAILGTLHRLHTAIDLGTDEESTMTSELLYANHSAKLRRRFDTYSGYSNFDGAKDVYETLFTSLQEYERNDRGQCVVVHGDPVLTNIIINKFGKVKLIDMRGKLGDTCTIRGDETYDWAKIYQSLIGYDEAMLDRKVSEQYRLALITTFWQCLADFSPNIRPDDVRTITKSLLFTLLPLHNAPDEAEKQQKYYKLLAKCTY